MRSSPDLYAVLHLAPQATPAEVRRAYRSLLRRHHPDARPAPATQGEVATEHEMLTQIMDAHAVLADPIRRARYDHNLPGSQIRQPTDRRDEDSGEDLIHVEHGYRPPAAPHERPSIIVGPLRWGPPRQGGIF
ncbi:J domain-containing protein [Arthrobacter livingstonensis]